jgi:putative transposase
MTAARAGQLRIGDFVRFDSQLHEIAGMDGTAVILLADSGRRLVIKSSVLLSDSTFALRLESHVSEVLDGVPAGSQPGTTPPNPLSPIPA